MKAYIVYRRIFPDSDEVQGYLVTEKGDVLATHYCSNIGWLYHDLIERRKEADEWKKKMSIIHPMDYVEFKNLTGIEIS